MKNKTLEASIARSLANVALSVLCVVLFVCANTNSCTMIHQPIAPKGLDQFSKLK